MSRLTSKGRVTIPESVRKALDLRQGDRIDFLVGADGSATLQKAGRPITALKGAVGVPGSPVSLQAMDKAIRSRP